MGSSIVTIWTARLALTVVDHGGKGGGLARPVGPGDQHQAAGLLGQAGDHRGRPSSPMDIARSWTPPQHQPDRAALAEGVDPVPPTPGSE